MGAFEYTALDTGGKERKGVLEGDTPRHIRQLLRERQLLPVTVNEVAQKESKRQQQTGSMSFSLSRRGISTADLSSPASWQRWCAPDCRSKNPCWQCRSRLRSREYKASYWECVPR
jgi:hypothetical protein